MDIGCQDGWLTQYVVENRSGKTSSEECAGVVTQAGYGMKRITKSGGSPKARCWKMRWYA